MTAAGGLKLGYIAFYGRTLAEYVRMFDLDLRALKGARLLDCPAGPASFAAEAGRKGLVVTACDPRYSGPLDRLRERGRRDVAHVVERVARARESFRWDRYRSPAALARERLRALSIFCEDYAAGRRAGRYVRGSLPRLPFPDKAFDLVLSGHLLFGYDEHLPRGFHEAAARELLRVSRGEVRVYPVVGDHGRPFPGLASLMARLRRLGARASLRKVPFEFQKGADRMLRLVK